MKFICVTLLIISGITDSRSEQYKVVGPADPVFAVAGEDVILPCFVKPSISVVDMRVEWFRLDLEDSRVHLYENHVDRNTDQIQSYRGRTELNLQELQRGNASLQLSSVRVSDEGLYKCFIQYKSWSGDATVNVGVEAVGHPPVITVDGFDHSGGLHLQCESEGWYPEPDLEWVNSEGVSLTSETTETQRNTDRFSVKHTITVHHRDDRIHCRVKLRHHVLETQIITSSKRFSSWRTSIILVSVAAVLSVIAGILIAVFVHKNREHIQLKNEHSQLLNKHSREQNEHSQLPNEHSQLQDEHSQEQNEHSQLQDEHSQLKNEYRQVQNKHSQPKTEHSQLQNERGQPKNEHSQLQNERGQPKNEHSQLQNEHSQLKNEHSQPKNEHSQPKNEHSQPKNEHSQLQNEHSQLKNEHSQPKNEHGQLKNEHGQPKNEHSQPKNEHSQPKNEHSQLQNEHSQLKNEHSQPKNEHGQLQNEHGQLQNEHSQPKNEHSQPKNEHSQLQNEHSQLKNEHSQPKNEHSQLKNEHSQPKNEHGQPKNEHGQLQNEHSQLQNEHSQSKNEHSQPKNEHGQLQNEHSQLKNEYRQVQNKHSQPKTELSQLQNEHSRVQNEHSQLQNEKRRKQHERDQLLKTNLPKAFKDLRTDKVNVVLDADTAHPHLIVSDDGKQVRSGNRQTKGVDGGKDRFYQYLGVVGKDGFSSRCFYFEVQVEGQTQWDLGVTRESVNRKGLIRLRPEDGCWTVGWRDGVYKACDSADFSLRVNPYRVGVFVDYEKGLVCFCDVKSKSHIYAYTDQSFNEKLYPFVCLGFNRNANSTPLIICDDS